MGNFDRDLLARLRGSAGIQAVMASDATLSRRAIDWVIRPDGAGLPAVVLTRVSINPDYDQDGRGTLEATNIQVDVYDTTHSAAARILSAIRAELEAEATQDDTAFKRAYISAGPRTMRADDLGDLRTFRLSADFEVWHKPAA